MILPKEGFGKYTIDRRAQLNVVRLFLFNQLYRVMCLEENFSNFAVPVKGVYQTILSSFLLMLIYFLLNPFSNSDNVARSIFNTVVVSF